MTERTISNAHILHGAYNELTKLKYAKCSFHPMMGFQNLPLNNHNGVIAPSIWKEVYEEIMKTKSNTRPLSGAAANNTTFGDLDFVLIGSKIGIIIFMVRSSSYFKDLKRGSKIDLPSKGQYLREDLENFQESATALKLLLEKSTNLKIDAAIPIQCVILLDHVEKPRFNQLTEKAKERFAGLTVWFKDDLKNASNDKLNCPLYTTLYGFLSETACKVAALDQCQKDSVRAIHETYVPLLRCMNVRDLGITEEELNGRMDYLDNEKTKEALLTEEAQLDQKSSSTAVGGITEEEWRKVTISLEEKTENALLQAMLLAEAQINPKASSTEAAGPAVSNTAESNLKRQLFLPSEVEEEVVLTAGRRIVVLGPHGGVGKTVTLLIKLLLLIEQEVDEEEWKAATNDCPTRQILIMMPESIRGRYDAFLRQSGFEIDKNYKICDDQCFFAYFNALGRLLPILCKPTNYKANMAFLALFFSEKNKRDSYARDYGTKNTADIVMDAMCSIIGKDLTPSTRAKLKRILDSIDVDSFKVLKNPKELTGYLQSSGVGDKILDSFESDDEREYVRKALKMPMPKGVMGDPLDAFMESCSRIFARMDWDDIRDMEMYIAEIYTDFLGFRPFPLPKRYYMREPSGPAYAGREHNPVKSDLEELCQFLQRALANSDVSKQLKAVFIRRR